jgi:hypothetical protein
MNLNSNVSKPYLLFCTVLFYFFGYSQVKRLTNIDLEEGAQYGWSCATNAQFVITGGTTATYKVRGKRVEEGGKVVVYKQLSGKWIVFQELTNPNMDNYGWFGNSLAISKDFLIVGASGYSRHNADDPFDREGIVYIYKLNHSNDKWFKKYAIRSPAPNKYGEFGEIVKLKGDTLAVFYEKGNSFYDLPESQCIAFYDLSKEEKAPFKTICLDKEGLHIMAFSFDFNHEYIVIGHRSNMLIYDFNENDISTIKKVKLGSAINSKGRVSNVKLNNNQLLVGFHEYAYDFWGYQPVVSSIKDGDSVLRKTIVNPTSKEETMLLLPKQATIFDKYDVTGAFFKEHAQVYESYESCVERQAGAGMVLVYALDCDTPCLRQTITASIRHVDDWFGGNIAVSNNNLIVSAMGYPDKTENHADYSKRMSGAVFHFVKNDAGKWIEKDIYRSLHKRRWDKFGFSLNNWNDFFVIGARFDQYTLDNSIVTGAVYILNLN